MSHFTVIVFGDEDLEDALEPFNENLEVDEYSEELGKWAFEHAIKMAKKAGLKGRNPSPERLAKILNNAWGENYFVQDGKIMERSTGNPDGHWDWWVLGGRWRGFFPLKESVAYNPRWHLGEPGTFEKMAIRDGKGPHANYEKKHVADRAHLKNIDFERCEREAEESARSLFAQWKGAFSKHPRPKGWRATREDGNPNEGGREAYRKQPAIIAFRELTDTRWGCPVDEFGFDEEAYVKMRKEMVLVPYAIIHEGQWIGQESDSFSSPIADPETHSWHHKVHALYTSLPGNTVVSMVDCHS